MNKLMSKPQANPVATRTAEGQALLSGLTLPQIEADDTRRTAVLMQVVAIGYWLAFWLMNGLDKFLNRTDLGAFTWYGKDRAGQFGDYFEKMGISSAMIDPVLTFAGIWEFLVAAPLAAALVIVARGRRGVDFVSLVNLGFVLSAVTMIAFSVFDVVAGDRAELREHGLYLVLILICWVMSTHGPGRRA